jgi:hypothetical protein
MVGSRPADDTVDPRTIYRMGRCDAMALALVARTSAVPALVIAHRNLPSDEWSEPDKPETEEIVFHAVAVLDKRKESWLDVDGIHEGFTLDGTVYDVRADRIEFRVVDVDEVRRAFAFAQGTQDEEIEEADRFIDQDPVLSAAVRDNPPARRRRR